MPDFKNVFVCATLSLLCNLGWSQTACQIKVFQNDAEVTATNSGGVLRYQLYPAEFRLEVLPAACYPSIATIPTTDVARQIAEKPLIYSYRLMYLGAARKEDGDKLLWWARTEFSPELLKSPDSNTFDGKQYLQLCDELRFCPKVFPTFSSNHPFTGSETGSKSEAVFRRLSDSQTLDSAKGKSVLSVIYTLWRALPSEYPMADPRQLLFRPHFVRFDFLESGPKP